MVRFSSVDPRLLKPPSQGLLAAIEEDKSIIDKLSDWLSPPPPDPVPDRPRTPTYPGALPGSIQPSMGELTVSDAASGLLAVRQRLSSAWPLMVEKAKAGRLTRAEMAIWNGTQWTLTEMELRLARRLVELDARTEDGKRLVVPSPDELQRRMQVGRFAGVPDATLGIVAGALVTWVFMAAGVLLTGAFALWAGSQLVKSFSAEELAKLDMAAELVDCVASGKCGQSALDAIKNLKLEEPQAGRLPGWAKGVIAIGATAVGVVLAVNIAPLFRSRR